MVFGLRTRRADGGGRESSGSGEGDERLSGGGDREEVSDEAPGDDIDWTDRVGRAGFRLRLLDLTWTRRDVKSWENENDQMPDGITIYNSPIRMLQIYSTSDRKARPFDFSH